MIKALTATVTCLGIVTLGVAMSRGQNQEEPKVDVLVPIEAEAEVFVAAEPQAVEAFEIAVDEAPIEFDVTVPVGVEFSSDVVHEIALDPAGPDGEVVIHANPGEHAKHAQVLSLVLADPSSRETLDRLAKELEVQADQLEKEGKKEEAEQKRQSLKALRHLLHHGPGTAGLRTRVLTPKQIELKHGIVADRLHMAVVEKQVAAHAQVDAAMKAKIDALRAQQKQLAAEQKNAEAAALEQEIQKLEEGLKAARMKFKMFAAQPNAAMKGIQGGVMAAPRMRTFAYKLHGGEAEADALTAKAKALKDAAAKLKEAGLGDQATEMAKAAEKLSQEAEQIRAAKPQGMMMPGMQGMRGMAMMGGGPPAELHRALHELQEQVQALRKEVGQLREILEKKQ